MRLAQIVIDKVKKKGVRIYFADRRITKNWNAHKNEGEPSYFGGWYWERTEKGRVVAMDEEGPFRSESAAIRDAYSKLQIR